KNGKDGKKLDKKDGKDGKNDKGDEVAAPATLIVNLPADARLTVDGAPTTSTSARRVFVSPELKPGKTYTYTLRAEFRQGGGTVAVTKDVAIKAGGQVTVSLGAADLAVAAR